MARFKSGMFGLNFIGSIKSWSLIVIRSPFHPHKYLSSEPSRSCARTLNDSSGRPVHTYIAALLGFPKGDEFPEGALRGFLGLQFLLSKLQYRRLYSINTGIQFITVWYSLQGKRHKHVTIPSIIRNHYYYRNHTFHIIALLLLAIQVCFAVSGEWKDST